MNGPPTPGNLVPVGNDAGALGGVFCVRTDWRRPLGLHGEGGTWEQQTGLLRGAAARLK